MAQLRGRAGTHGGAACCADLNVQRTHASRPVLPINPQAVSQAGNHLNEVKPFNWSVKAGVSKRSSSQKVKARMPLPLPPPPLTQRHLRQPSLQDMLTHVAFPTLPVNVNICVPHLPALHARPAPAQRAVLTSSRMRQKVVSAPEQPQRSMSVQAASALGQPCWGAQCHMPMSMSGVSKSPFPQASLVWLAG